MSVWMGCRRRVGVRSRIICAIVLSVVVAAFASSPPRARAAEGDAAPGSPAQLGITGMPASTTAGVAFVVTIKAQDSFGATTPGYTGTIHFTSTDRSATLPADYTYTSADAGIRTFSVALKTAGRQAVRARDVATGTMTSVASTTVDPGPATHFLLRWTTDQATAGVPSSLSFLAADDYHNTATGYRGTVTFNSSDPTAVLPPGYTFTAMDAGVHSFSATFKTAGSQGIRARDALNATITGRRSITVYPAVATHLTLEAVASLPAQQAGHWAAYYVIPRDAFGNETALYAGTVHYTSTDRRALLPADHQFVASWLYHPYWCYVTFGTSGLQTIRVRDTVTPTMTATLTTQVVPGEPFGFAISVATPVTSGAATTVTVRSVDRFGNTVTGYDHAIRFTSTDVGAILPADYAFTPSDAGVHVFSVTFKTAGSQTIRVRDTASKVVTATRTVLVD